MSPRAATPRDDVPLLPMSLPYPEVETFMPAPKLTGMPLKLSHLRLTRQRWVNRLIALFNLFAVGAAESFAFAETAPLSINAEQRSFVDRLEGDIRLWCRSPPAAMPEGGRGSKVAEAAKRIYTSGSCHDIHSLDRASAAALPVDPGRVAVRK